MIERLARGAAASVRLLASVAAPAGQTRRLRGLWCVVVAGLTLALLPVLKQPAPSRVTAVRADDVTASVNTLRTGLDPNEPSLSPSLVESGEFGQVFSTAVNGQVYAQPIVVGSTLIVATENDWVYGLNAATGAVKWSRSLGTPYNITWCPSVSPNVGATSTPVYDPANGRVYVMAQTVASGGYPTYHLFAINPQTGGISLAKPIGGTPTNDPNIKFNAKYELARPGLLLMNGWIYAAFGSHCDVQPYAGYVAGVNVSTKASTLWTDESGVTNDQAGIWQSGGGLMSDGPGRIFFTSGNGVSPPPGPGISPPGQLAESTVRLAVQSGGSLVAGDFFSPANAPSLDAGDIDFGSGAPVGLPFGTATYPHVLAEAGKDGRLFLLNRDSLGGRKQGTGGTDAALSVAGPYAGQWGHPAAFGDTTTLTARNSATANDYLYYVGKDSYLRVLKAADSSAEIPTLSDVADSSFTFGYTSGSPVVTSNGTDPSSAVLWEVQSSDKTGQSGALDAFSAVPPSSCTAGSPCSLAPIWSAPIGHPGKFTIPATSNGMVYVGTRDGHVLGFGVTGNGALAKARPTSFGHTAVGSSTTAAVTVAATKRVTVTGVSARSPLTPGAFALGQVTETVHGVDQGDVTFPVTLRPGDRLHAAARFRPSVPGGVTGSLRFGTDSTPAGSVNVPLYGNGTKPGLYATSTSLALHRVLDDGTTISDVPVGISVRQTVDIVNGGTSPEKVTTVQGPAPPFTARGLPKPGSIIQPGEAVPVQVAFGPMQAASSTSSLTVAGSTGASARVTLSGTGLPPVSRFTASPTSVKFGTVRAERTATAWVHITNAGNQPAAMSGTRRLTRPFGTPYAVARGLPVNGGSDLRIPITFKPTKGGKFAAAYRLVWSDRLGTHAVEIPLAGRATP